MTSLQLKIASLIRLKSTGAVGARSQQQILGRGTADSNIDQGNFEESQFEILDQLDSKL